MAWLERQQFLDETSVVLQKTPVSFDAAQWEVLACANGARLVLAGQGAHRRPGDMLRAVADERVTTLQCVPTLWAALLDEPGLPGCTTLAHAFSGGEALSSSLAARLTAALPRAGLINLYGPTECTINSTWHRVSGEDLSHGPQIVPIGRPVDDVLTRVVDDRLNDVPDGVPGQLLLGGPQLAEGYANDPEKTSSLFVIAPDGVRYYQTGDVVHRDDAGVLHFHGRRDSQVKHNGHRVELEEIDSRVEEHGWVRRAATAVVPDGRTGRDQLVVCAELDPVEAALMDQGEAGAHHLSKTSRVQVRAQLAGAGVRDLSGVPEGDVVRLPEPEDLPGMRRAVFARKTYRQYRGGAVSCQDLAGLMSHRVERASVPARVGVAELGAVLRWFGQFRSPDRLLPKYSYASPGALYGVQLHAALSGVGGVRDGVHYYDPAAHRLARLADLPPGFARIGAEFHFRGLPGVIGAVYRQNVREVLEFETGHMVGALELALAGLGYGVVPAAEAGTGSWEELLSVDGQQDCYLGGFRATSDDAEDFPDLVRTFVQAHGDRVAGLDQGIHEWADGRFEPVSADIVESRDVIAINQRTYAEASFGVALVAKADDALSYTALGRALHLLQASPCGLGLMSSGYSSRSGHPLAASRRLERILGDEGITVGASYFAVGGRVSPEQRASEGMDEDAVHMLGPAELIREELARTLPSYMLPSRVILVERLPLSPSGKVDHAEVSRLLDQDSASRSSRFVAPVTVAQRWLAAQCSKLLGVTRMSVEDDFFAAGGTSLSAVQLAGRIRSELGVALPVQDVFNAPRLDLVAEAIEQLCRTNEDRGRAPGRLVRLGSGPGGTGRPVFVWPGLGGSPAGLRPFGSGLKGRRAFGVQALGINDGEAPVPSIEEMARLDVEEIRGELAHGPYALAGYSFGARVAFEAAWQLEQAGEEVASLLLVCPGNPMLGGRDGTTGPRGRSPGWGDLPYLRILGSVFTGTVSDAEGDRIARDVHDLDSFVRYVSEVAGAIDEGAVRRIVEVVATTYSFEYTIEQLSSRRLSAPIAVVRARGDDYSFLDGAGNASGIQSFTVSADHYSILREDVDELIELVDAHGLLGSPAPVGGGVL